MTEITLYSMLGAGITQKAKFQWIKTFGEKNVWAGKEEGEPLIIDREYICKSFRESQKQQRTTSDLASIMMYSYLQWVRKPENTSLRGIIAEEIHNRVMMSIAKYWKRSWAPEKHKVPMYGIWNLFNIIKRFVQSDFSPHPNPKITKLKANVAILKSTTLIGNFSYDNDNQGRYDAYSPRLTPSVNYDWSAFDPDTPLDIMINSEDSDEV